MSMRQLPIWLAAVWSMSLSMLGLVVVPMLFAHMPTPAMAGQMAAQLFTAQTWISTVCGVLLLMTFRSGRDFVPAETAKSALVFVVLGVLLALLVELGVAPHIVAHDNLAFWHSVGSAMYLVQWLCALVVFAKMASLSDPKATHS